MFQETRDVRSLGKGKKVWLGPSFRADGQSLRGTPGEVVSSYRQNKNQYYMIRTEKHGLIHGRLQDFLLKDPNPAE